MYGETLKKIRKSKNYSQQEISAGHFTQAAYSVFEQNKSDMNATNFLFVLDQLKLSVEELSFIHNDYQLSSSAQIIKSFYSIPYNQKNEFEKLLSKIEQYLKENPENLYIQEIKIVCNTLLLLINDENQKAAQKMVLPIWERISNYDQYYYEDIKILNMILFLFEYETVKHITQQLIRQLDKYKDFKDSQKIKSSIILNYSILCIQNQDIIVASKYLNEIFKFQNQLPYSFIAIAFNRIAICNTYLNPSEVEKYCKKRDMLLDVFEDENFKERLQNEFHTYAKND